MKIRLFTFYLLFAALHLAAQEKKKISADTYNEWASIKSVSQAPSGTWVAYELAYLEGDGEIKLRSTSSSREVSFARGKQASFCMNEGVFVLLIEPQFDTLRKLKLDETPREKLPKDSLVIYWISGDSSQKFPEVKSYQCAKNSPWVLIQKSKDLRPDCPETKKKKKKNPCSKPATSGTTLVVFNTETAASEEIHCVSSYQLSENGEHLLYSVSSKGKKDTLEVYYRNLISGETLPLLKGQFAVSKFTFDDNSTRFAFLSSTDTNKVKSHALYCSELKDPAILKKIDSLSQGMPAGWNVSEFGALYYSKSGDKLYFGTNKLVVQEPEDTLLESEKASVDIWGSTDERIQPQQLVELNSDKRQYYTAVYSYERGEMTQIATEKVPSVRINTHSTAQHVLGMSDLPYQREYAWTYPWKSDYHLIDTKTGMSQLVLEGQAFTTSLSPSGNFIAYYKGQDSSWYCLDAQTRQTICPSQGIKEIFASDNNGNPSLAEEQGFEGWTLINGEEFFLVNSQTNVWALSTTDASKSFCLTGAKTESEKQVYTYYRIDLDSMYTQIPHNFFIAVDELTKNESIYTAGETADHHFILTKKLSTHHKIVSIDKAEDSDRVLLRRMNFQEYPDLEATDLSFQNLQKISDANPQQKEYNWGTVEFVSWTSFSGIPLRGLLYKPEDFDSTKVYPMIVYFYEKYTDDIHNYYAPKPTASIVLPTEYVSNGYIIFIPDIIYTPGHPAKSAYDCIVSGTDNLTRKYSWIDSTRLGLQGQSWGGYQTAQLVTMTQKYKAAMAGAPVSNMFSAYGGIRWGSGLSRMFQYERTQSRIGYTIWERPDLYIENSPVFGLPNVRTPLLIMSNDGDGAVPWYQGIELYMGLRRLNQPVWLLNYNDDEHNLTQLANKRDLSIRMRQFFDYYLLGAPMPVWMKEGVDAIDKGKTYGYELEIEQD